MLKLAGSKPTSSPAPESTPAAEPVSDDSGFGGEPSTEEPATDKPFDDEPFDAGVEADENSDPKKYIEQLTGKLGQSLRKYNEEKGQPDLELEKFSINSLLAATHTSEMDPKDQDDIIKKVKTAGNNDNKEDSNDDNSDDANASSDDNGVNDSGFGGSDSGAGSDGGVSGSEASGGVNEEKETSLFLDKPKKNNMFQPGSNDKLNESCWKGYKQIGMKEKNGKEVPNCVPINEGIGDIVAADGNLNESLIKSKKSSIFDKIKSKLHETFNQDDMETAAEPMIAPEPTTKPKVTPTTKPSTSPSRKNKPFLPMPEVQPDPKAMNESKWGDIMKSIRINDGGPWSIVAIQNNKVVGQDINIKIQDAIPAHYEEMKRKYPNSTIGIENAGGQRVWTDR